MLPVHGSIKYALSFTLNSDISDASLIYFLFYIHIFPCVNALFSHLHPAHLCALFVCKFKRLFIRRTISIGKMSGRPYEHYTRSGWYANMIYGVPDQIFCIVVC